MHRPLPIALLLVLLASPLLAGCDAMRGATYRFEVVDGASGEPVPGAIVRLFWFDEPEDVLGRGPVEERAREVGDERRRRDSGGEMQEEWIEAETDAAGAASPPAFGILWSPKGMAVGDVLSDAPGGSPTGLWIRVAGKGPPQDFVVVGDRAAPRLVRVRTVEGLPAKGEEAGRIVHDPVDGSSGNRWRIVVPIAR